MIEIVASTSRFATAGWGGRFTLPSYPGHGGFFNILATIFVLYSNDLPSEALSST